MKIDKCLQDPVFQLNLLLWMAKDQPKECYRVRPLFRELGYDILYVENPFPFPEMTRNAIEKSELTIAQNPEPELILRNPTLLKALYFEAKKQSFGTQSTTAKQARGHLIATGPDFSEVFAPLKSCLLCYVLPDGAREGMRECLQELSMELSENGLPHGSSSIHGLSYSDTQVIYLLDDIFKQYTGLDEDECSLMEISPGDINPSPLLLVYSDEDCFNSDDRDFYRTALIGQIRATLLCQLHSLDVGQILEITADILLEKTTDGIFAYLGSDRRKSLRKFTKENILREIAKRWSDKQEGVRMSEGVLTVHWRTITEKTAFLDWIEDRNTHFGTSKPPEDPQIHIEFEQNET